MMDYKKRRSQRQERRLAKEFGGKVQPGSGCGRVNKGDVKSEHFLIEAKRTDKKQYIFKLLDWETIRDRALAVQKTPLMALEIGNQRLVVVAEADLCVLAAISQKIR